MDGNGFDLTERISVGESDLSWHVLGKALRWGAQLRRGGMPWGSGADVCANSGPFR